MKKPWLIVGTAALASIVIFILFFQLGTTENENQSVDASIKLNSPGSPANLPDHAGFEKQLQTSMISLSLQDVSVGDTLKMISRLSGVPIRVVSPLKNDQKLTLALQDTPVLDALNMVAGMASLQYNLATNGIEVSQK